MSRFLWIISQLSSRLWVNASLYGVVAVITPLLAILLKQFIPFDLPQKIGADSVGSILNILATSMLSVTIFSLSTMVAAYGAATSNVTPRATQLLIEDKLSHRALSTFLGAFIFSIVGIVTLQTGVYGEKGRLILFVVTIGVIVMIVVALLSWIEYLARLGRVTETIDRVERAATVALETRLRTPYLGGVPLLQDDAIPADAVPVAAETVAYVQHIDMPHLAATAQEYGVDIYVAALPGKFLDATLPLAHVRGELAGEEVWAEIRRGFIMGHTRSFRQDPRFGLAVLHEIAIRALSPAINDPGTAIQVIGTGVRILSRWAERKKLVAPEGERIYQRVYVPPLKADDMFDDFFPPIARDGATSPEVQIRLQKAFAALARTGDAELIRYSHEHAAQALARAEQALTFAADKERLQEVAQWRAL
ncbi:MAG: DUF2254 domain-containing protein [Verrucomicrobiota bacterium JB022]|nr:DUF2254 domain-containing protein [Verrucomicrobiota bacterium JB022]